jgi:hypothetical protein
MTSMTRPKGPLPSRVYWTRRLLVLGLTLGLVSGASHLLDGAEPPASTTPSARPAAAVPSSPAAERTPAARTTAESARDKGEQSGKKRKPRPSKTPLAVPTGVCADDDIIVTPAVGTAYAGQDVTMTLELTTKESPACNWQVSSSSVVVKLTSGSDRIWSTQDCPAAVEDEAVVVRKGQTTKVEVVWSGQRSDDECSRTTLWAEPGYYHVAAAAFGAEPTDRQFHLFAHEIDCYSCQ